MTQTVSLKINIPALLENLRLSFTEKETFLAELMQNARRAGASFVTFDYDANARRLVVSDDGHGIADMQNLLHIAESGWRKEIKETEHPYGMGFLAALFAADEVVVESRGQRLAFDTTDALALNMLVVSDSDVTAGTRITLDGIGFDPAHALHRFAKGYPIEVLYNGESLARPHALDGPLAFEPCKFGYAHLPDIDAPLGDTALGTSLGTSGFLLYLQGIEVYRSVRYSSQFNIIHLDPRQFKGRLPDRDKLVDERDACKLIADYIAAQWSARLEVLAAITEEREFAENGYHTLRTWGRLDLLNRNDYLPSHVITHVSRYPIASNLWESIYDGCQEPVAREDIESGKTRIIDLHHDNIPEEPFQSVMYAWLSDAMILSGKLDKDHWVHQHVVSVDDDDIHLTLYGSDLFCAEFTGRWIWSASAVFCEKAVLDGPLGPVDVAHDAFYFGGDRIQADNGLLPAGAIENVVVVPSGERGGAVVRQLSSFIDESDTYLDGDAEEEAAMFVRFILANTPGGECDALKHLLDDNGICALATLRGKTFVVEVPTDGGEVSVRLAEENTESPAP